MPIFIKKTAILAKVETTAGTDAVPTGAANAILARNINISPIEQQLEDRDLAASYLGNSDSVIAAAWTKLDFEVELAGAGAAGTAPKWGPLMRACMFSETIAAGVSATYAPVSGVFDRLTIYINVDGVLHKMLYAAGNVALSLNARKIPFLKFSFTGLFVPVTDSAAPAASYGSFQKPLAVNKANTPTCTLFAVAATLDKFELDMGNQVVYRNLVNHESVQIVDRAPAGSLSTEAVTVATRDLWTAVASGNKGGFALVHGTTAGNIVELNAPALQIMSPKYSNSDGVAMFDCSYKLTPGSSGNDEFTLVVR